MARHIGRLVSETCEVVVQSMPLEPQPNGDHYPGVIILDHARVFEDREFARLDDDTTLVTYYEISARWAATASRARPDPYNLPFQHQLRQGAAVCVDDDCGLSGGMAHAGPCEKCGCSDEHAIAECPSLREMRV